MGFCLFNNVAIAARRLKKRVLIVDWDVHHGNGTQDTFYSDSDVFYLSTHRSPFYPGTGSAEERGRHNNILNVPLPGGTTSSQFLQQFEAAVHETVEFKPEFVIISCGFDAYVNDPIGGLGVEAADFGKMTRIVRELGVPIVSALEGGYSLQGLGPCAESHLRALME